jgi:hypothetical protein
MFVIIISCILLLFTFWTNHSIWMPMFDFMQLMFALFFINVNLPPNVLYAFGQLKDAGFVFLINFFTKSLPDAKYSTVVNNNIYSILKDFTFLRTQGYLYSLLIFIIVVLFLIYIISKKFFIK